MTGPTLETVCTIANPNIANNFTRTTCVPASGSKIQFTTTTTEDTTFYSGGVPSGALPTVTTVTPLADVDGVCYAPNVTAPALPSPNPQPPAWTAADADRLPELLGLAVRRADGAERRAQRELARRRGAVLLRHRPAPHADGLPRSRPTTCRRVGSGAEDDTASAGST